MKTLCLIATTGLFLMSCSTNAPLKSSHQVAAPSRPIEGVIYSLPLSRVDIEYDLSKVDIITRAETRTFPDPRSNYLLEAQFAASASDVFKLKVGNQLLQSVNADTDEMTDAIVKSTLTGLRDAVRLEPRIAGAPQTAKTKGLISFNPYRGSSHYNNQIKVRPYDPSFFARANRPREKCPDEASVCFPLLTSIEVTAEIGGLSSTRDVVVVDPTYVIGINLSRTTCVAVKNKLLVSDGVLTDYVVEKPSQLAACASIPLDIIKAIIAAPVDAITGRTGRLEAENRLLEAKSTILESRLALEAAEKNAKASQGTD